MEDRPLVSVITPTLDRAGELQAVLDCIRRQTYPDVEHIVVDGGSKDDTVSILEKAEKTHGLRWTSEPDLGVYDAVNKGLRVATGDVVAYLNTDDRYFPFTVETAVRELRRNEELGFVYGDILRFDPSRGSGRIVFYPPFDQGVLHRGALIAQPTVFWRRAVTERIGLFDLTFELSADIEYWNRMARIVPGKRLEEVLAYEGEHGERLTSGSRARRVSSEELRRIRQVYSTERSSRVVRVADRARAAFWYRASIAKFLLSMQSGHEGEPGRRWRGFHAHASQFSVSRSRLAAVAFPFVGRKRPDFVTLRDPPPIEVGAQVVP